MPCPFCQPTRPIIHQNDKALAIYDGYPVAQGHTLIIPKKHVKSLFEISMEEQRACWQLVNEVRDLLSRENHPHAFTIGINDGEAAGQTIMHAHIHVIPRWEGDVENPTGGVRKALDRGEWGK